MKRSLLTVLAIVSACTTPALADEFEGAASIGASYSNIHGQQAKFNEYRTLGDGAQGSLDMNYRADSGYYLEGATDFNVTDSSKTNDVNLNIKTGLQDVFKGSIFYNEIPHNITFGAKTFQNGVGSNSLTSTTAVTAASFTNVFDYGINRYNYGAEAEFSLKSPYFLLVRVERNETNGLMPMTVRLTSANHELPAPIDYTNDTLFLQAGYRGSNLIATVDGTLSSFRNDNETFTYQVNSVSSRAYLPANNQYFKLGSSVMYKIPFLSSTLMARASHSYLNSDFTFLESIPAGRTSWDGKVQETSASFSITSNPTSKLNTKIYYSYFDRSNDSDKGFNYSTGTGIVKTFSYHKNNVGLDINYKLPANTKVAAGYEFSVTDRELTYRTATDSSFSSSPETVDHRFYAQVKNDLFDWMSARVKVQRLIRQSDFDYRSTSASGTLVTNVNRYWFKPVGVADKLQDTLKAGLDFNVLDNLGLGIEYVFTQNNYNHTIAGVKDDDRHGINFDASYSFAAAKVNVYADVEKVRTKGLYFESTAGTPSYTSTRRDFNYALGTNGDVDIIKDKLLFGAGYRYERADGSNDFTRSDATAFTNVENLDDYIKNSVDAKLSYKFNKNLTVDLGYIYEQLKYSDDAYSIYNNIAGFTGPAGGLFYQTGAYANPDYTANVFYTKLNFKF